METQAVRALAEVVKSGVSLSLSTWVFLLVGVLIASGLGAYVAHKGRNLATKEDVADITRKVEEVKAVFATQLEDQAQQNRLRLAALDKRLEVHQEAYVRWRKLLSAVYTDQIVDVVIECQNWWIAHCLYLNAEVREAFVTAWLAAERHRDLLRSQGNQAAVYKNWDELQACGDAVLRSAGLPGFGTHEKDQVKALGERGDG